MCVIYIEVYIVDALFQSDSMLICVCFLCVQKRTEGSCARSRSVQQTHKRSTQIQSTIFYWSLLAISVYV